MPDAIMATGIAALHQVLADYPPVRIISITVATKRPAIPGVKTQLTFTDELVAVVETI